MPTSLPAPTLKRILAFRFDYLGMLLKLVQIIAISNYRTSIYDCHMVYCKGAIILLNCHVEVSVWSM